MNAKVPSRTPQSCTYRENPRPGEDGEVATCGLLREISGVDDEGLVEAHVKACEVCCKKAPPTAEHINSVIASLLYGVAIAVRERGGVPGCDVEKTEDLEMKARQSLEVLSFPEDNFARRIPYTSSCFYLGEQTGERLCESCRGHVRQKVFRCEHQLHNETLIQQCQRCPDYDPQLATGAGTVETWAVGLTTAPRDEPTLDETLASLAEAGWERPLIFCEPETPLPPSVTREQIVPRMAKLGAWPNWLLGLSELYLREPKADAYLMVQDDVTFAGGLRKYLEETLWPDKRLGVVSLHTASHQDRGDLQGYYASDCGWAAWGAQAYVLPNASARALLAHPRIINHRHRGPRDGLANVDSIIGKWCKDSGLAYYFHTPSLTQHTGETSTLWDNATLEGRRSAATFVDQAPTS